MIGWGVTAAHTCASAIEAETWWRDFVESARVMRPRDAEEPLGASKPADDLADEPMAGPVAFISFPFAPDGLYEVIVPHIVQGSRNGHSWQTQWDRRADDVSEGGAARDDTASLYSTARARGTNWVPADAESLASQPLAFRSGNLDREHWLAAVAAAVAHITDGQLEKVVLARDEVAEAATPIDVSTVLTQLAQVYPQTWTFYVKGLVGASPELLVRQDRGLITSRVLAGTIAGEADDAALAQALSSSSKDLAEHEYAVASVAAGLRPHVTSLHVPEVPFVLRLPNVMHLASDITGAAKPGATVVGLATAIHPSAAVCGTPTQAARRVIAELEHMDRGRYAGPVGWVNASGDGEIALALRCGQITDQTVRLFAGCGIVAGSDPEAEWNETVAKLRPMKQALLSQSND
ncbi:MAG: chorismate-binding protein [Propionibacteriaceae bacterium]|jgi:menaquinone-specific isochorismate synthase|nr:chorismate-binding protein [Propionibacteriaceae bacterium]